MHIQRPLRFSVPNFLGRSVTLNSGEGAFTLFCKGGNEECVQENMVHIVLGGAAFFPRALLADSVVYHIENTSFMKCLRELEDAEKLEFPTHSQFISLDELQVLMQVEGAAITFWWYKQNVELDTDFWLPILGQVLACIHGMAPLHGKKEHSKAQKQVVIGCEEFALLGNEIATAFAELGYMHSFCSEGKAVQSIQTHCENVALFFSINLAGLDKAGQNFALLQALGIPVALWFVDNPWHVLTKLRLPWWKKARIFVTDASFIPTLRQEGAEHVHHLPLAVAQHMWEMEDATKAQCRNEAMVAAIQAAQECRCVFVGRASFPEKKSFFAAVKLDPEELSIGLEILKNNLGLPHFHWWALRLLGNATTQQGIFWPNKAIRTVGLFAEECAQAQRVQWLKALISMPCAIFGDVGAWQTLLPQAPANIFYPELDYYGALREIYSAAPSVLNVTSLLLPEGLTQRHFDVWAAGGFLWSNYTNGLRIFPQELVKPIAFSAPEGFHKALATLSNQAKYDLKLGWQEHLREKHQYTHRMQCVLELVSAF